MPLRPAVCGGPPHHLRRNWTPEYCASLNEEDTAQLRQEKQAGWACYLHTTKDVPDGMVSVNHKTGHIEHLFVTEKPAAGASARRCWTSPAKSCRSMSTRC